MYDQYIDAHLIHVIPWRGISGAPLLIPEKAADNPVAGFHRDHV